MKDNWHDQTFATDWDTDSALSNPSRTLLLDLLVSIVSDSYVEGNKILDLGFGSGHLESQLIAKIPTAQIVGVDSSEVMIAKAKEKLQDNPNVIMIKHDLNSISDLVLPEGIYQYALTSFVLHEVPAIHKREIFEFIYKNIKPDGMYILVDRFKIDSDGLEAPFTSQWNWQNRLPGWKNKNSFDQYKKDMSVKEDSPDSLEDQLTWLRDVGFKAGCLQLQLDRGLIVGVK